MLPTREQEHASEILLTEALRHRPMRTLDEDTADFFVVPLFLSLTEGGALDASPQMQLCGKKFGWTMGNGKRRLQKAGEALMRSAGWRQGKPHLFFFAQWWRRRLLGPLLDLLGTSCNTIVATGEKGHMLAAEGLSNLFTLPYVPHFIAMGAAATGTVPQTQLLPPHSRNISFLFRGSSRRGEGQYRRLLLPLIQQCFPETADVRIIEHEGDQPGESDVDYGEQLLRARFCLVPAGDTSTSRRLFDALAVGCIPIILGTLANHTCQVHPDGTTSDRDNCNLGEFAIPAQCKVVDSWGLC